MLAGRACGRDYARADLDRSGAFVEGYRFPCRSDIIAFDGTPFEIDAQSVRRSWKMPFRNSVRALRPNAAAPVPVPLSCLCRRGVVEKVGSPEPMEEDMLAFAFDMRPTSRLSCQIKMSDAFDGLVVRVLKSRPDSGATCTLRAHAVSGMVDEEATPTFVEWGNKKARLRIPSSEARRGAGARGDAPCRL